MKLEFVLSLLRHGLTAGGAVLATNGTLDSSEVEQGIGGLLALVSVAWSYFDKRAKAKAKAAGGSITLLLVLGCILPAALLLTGCMGTATPPTGSPLPPQETKVLTPQRVERITRLAVWTTTVGWTARNPESEAKFRKALQGIDALVAEENWDVVALSTALTSSGSDTFTGPEGKLIVAGTTLLIDAFAGDKVDVRKAEYAQSVILGAQAGLRLALGGAAPPQ